MKKVELYRQVWERQHRLTMAEVRNIVDIVFDVIADGLAEDGVVKIPPVGVLEVEKRVATVKRNPRTGDLVNVSEKRVVKFRAVKALKERINPV